MLIEGSPDHIQYCSYFIGSWLLLWVRLEVASFDQTFVSKISPSLSWQNWLWEDRKQGDLGGGYYNNLNKRWIRYMRQIRVVVLKDARSVRVWRYVGGRVYRTCRWKTWGCETERRVTTPKFWDWTTERKQLPFPKMEKTQGRARFQMSFCSVKFLMPFRHQMEMEGWNQICKFRVPGRSTWR